MHADSETVIRKIEYEDLDAAFQLIKNVFQEFVAPDYPQEGIESFYNYFTPESSYRSLPRERKPCTALMPAVRWQACCPFRQAEPSHACLWMGNITVRVLEADCFAP